SLRPGGVDSQGRLERLEEGKQYHFLTGILDPLQRRTNAPVTLTSIQGESLEAYNQIIDGVEKLNSLYWDTGGFVDAPDTFSEVKQREVKREINDLGVLIYGLFYKIKTPETPIESSEIRRDSGKAPRPPLHVWLDGVVS